MANPSLTPEDVKEILRRNGIESIDQLANIIASNQAGKPFSPDINPLSSSWIIKIWKLDKGAPDIMPDDLGGDIIKKRFGGGVGGGQDI